MSDIDDNAPPVNSLEGATFYSEVTFNQKPGLAVLRGPTLLFFSNKDKTVDTDAEGVFPIENATITEITATKFTISAEGEKGVEIEVKASEIGNRWIAELKKAAKESSLKELAPEHQEKLKQFIEKLNQEIKVEVTEENQRLEVVRFLKKGEWDVQKAFILYNDYVQWRGEFGVDDLKMKDVQKELMAGKLIFLSKPDKRKRPIIVLIPRNHERANSTLLTLQQAIVYVVERALEVAPDQQITLIVDMAGLSKESVDVRVPKTIFDILMNRYPYVVGEWCIVNQPIFFTGLWHLISRWLDADLLNRIHVLGSTDRLKTFVDPAHLTIDLGGTAEDSFRDWIRLRYKTEGWTFHKEGNEGAESSVKAQSAKQRIMAAVSSEPPVVEVLEGSRKSGYLSKEGGFIKRFQKQYFVLKENVLYYFKDDKGQRPEGVISLNNAKVESGGDAIKKPHAFIIVTTLRNHFFAAESQQEKEQWMEAIRAEIVNF